MPILEPEHFFYDTEGMNMRRKLAFICSSLLIGSSIAGCSSPNQTKGQDSPPAPAAAAPKPVEAPAEFVILLPESTLPEDFQKSYVEVLSKKFPNTKFTSVSLKGTNLTNIVTAGTPFDMIEWGITNSQGLIDLDVPMDLDPLVKKYNFQLNRIDASAITSIRSYSTKNELILLPTEYQPFVLNYNKDIFDKFGIAYPKEGNTWDDLIALAKTLTRTDGGVKYRGLDAGLNINRMQLQLSLPYVDAKTEKSLIASTAGWAKMFKTYEDIYTIPGNINDNKKLGNGTNVFLKDRNLAMYPHLISIATETFASAIKDGLKMGITTYPVFKDLPGISTGFFGQGLYIPKKSRYPDFAFQVMDYMMSDEVQMQRGREGKPTALVSTKVQGALFEGNAIAKDIGLNTSLVYKNKNAGPYGRTPWDSNGQTIVTNALNRVIAKETDINTAIRQADEELNKAILANPKK
jgi:multiple sugar transport system substrate-binding protein